MASVSSRESLQLARRCVMAVVEKRAAPDSFYARDDVLTILSRITMEALDCALAAKPLDSATLKRFADEMIYRDRESDIAKFAYAFSVLLSALSGSIFGLEKITVVDDSMQDLASLSKEELPEASTTVTAALPLDPIEAEPDLSLFNGSHSHDSNAIGGATNPVELEPEDASFPPCSSYEISNGVKLEEEMEEEEPLGLVKMEPEEEAQHRHWLLQRQLQQRQEHQQQQVLQVQHIDETEEDEVPTRTTRRRTRGKKRPSESEKMEENRRSVQAPKSAVADASVDRRFYCSMCQMKVDEMEMHEQEEHGEQWLRQSRKCPAIECDFRSLCGPLISHHAKSSHYGLKTFSCKLLPKTSCPYCKMVVTNLVHFIMHLGTHREMWNNQALIYICNECDFKSARVYQMIEHWNEQAGECMQGLKFDYAAAAAAAEAKEQQAAAAAQVYHAAAPQ